MVKTHYDPGEESKNFIAWYRSEADIERLRFITRTKVLGLTLDEIKEILALKEGQALTCQAVQERLAAKLAKVREQIQQLQILKQDLQSLLKQCELAPPNQACVVLETGVLQNPVNP